MYNAVILLIYGVMESERLFILKNNLAQCVSHKRKNRIRGVKSKKKRGGGETKMIRGRKEEEGIGKITYLSFLLLHPQV